MHCACSDPLRKARGYFGGSIHRTSARYRPITWVTWTTAVGLIVVLSLLAAESILKARLERILIDRTAVIINLQAVRPLRDGYGTRISFSKSATSYWFLCHYLPLQKTRQEHSFLQFCSLTECLKSGLSRNQNLLLTAIHKFSCRFSASLLVGHLTSAGYHDIRRWRWSQGLEVPQKNIFLST